jgi:hypothetical protein
MSKDCSCAPAEIKHLHGTMPNDLGLLRMESCKGDFGSDPFEELELKEEVHMLGSEQVVVIKSAETRSANLAE